MTSNYKSTQTMSSQDEKKREVERIDDTTVVLQPPGPFETMKAMAITSEGVLTSIRHLMEICRTLDLVQTRSSKSADIALFLPPRFVETACQSAGITARALFDYFPLLNISVVDAELGLNFAVSEGMSLPHLVYRPTGVVFLLGGDPARPVSCSAGDSAPEMEWMVWVPTWAGDYFAASLEPFAKSLPLSMLNIPCRGQMILASEKQSMWLSQAR